MRKCYRFSTGMTPAGKRFDTFVAILIVLNVVAVIAESEPTLGSRAGLSEETVQEIFDGFEASRPASPLIFAARPYTLLPSKMGAFFPPSSFRG